MKTRTISISALLLSTLLLALAGCAPRSQNSLTVEEHLLSAAPQSEPFEFTPRQGSRAEMLQAHAAERGRLFADPYAIVDGNLSIPRSLGGEPLVATQVFTDGAEQSHVDVTLAGSPIYRIETGPASPLTTLVGLWTYDDAWALETVLIDLEGETFATGQITINGVLQNELKGYQEAFGLQTIAGRPFYFFKKGSNIGYWYDGRETMLSYEEVPHYLCCGESAINPIQAEDMVAFFARAGQDWSYVEIGKFGE